MLASYLLAWTTYARYIILNTHTVVPLHARVSIFYYI